MIEDYVKKFECEEDLSIYVDSMLFDSGWVIAQLEYDDGENQINIELKVCGDVRVDYKGELFRYPSEFPKELRTYISDNPYWYNDNDDLFIWDNNWFEFIYHHINEKEGFDYSDGVVYEDDLSEDTSDGIRNYMLDIVEYLIKDED